MLALDLHDVSKTYRGRIHALRGISMQINRGEIFGLLGPNGAGKSTLVKILMTVIRASAARGTLLGQPLGHKPTLARVGYLPEHHRFPDYLTGRQVIDFYGALADTPRARRRARCDELLDFVGLRAWANDRIRSYSKGMRQRVGLAQALVNDPDLVILDEPTDGVDPVGRRDIRAMLQSLRERGVTILLNSHLLSELEMVCDRVAILVKGQVRAQGTLDDLTVHQQRYEITLAGAPVVRTVPSTANPAPATPDFSADFARALAPLGITSTKPDTFSAALPSGEALSAVGPLLRVATTDPQVIQPVLDALRAAGLVIRSVRPFRPTLEDLFMEAVTDPLTGATLAPGAGDHARRGLLARLLPFASSRSSGGRA